MSVVSEIVSLIVIVAGQLLLGLAALSAALVSRTRSCGWCLQKRYKRLIENNWLMIQK